MPKSSLPLFCACISFQVERKNLLFGGGFYKEGPVRFRYNPVEIKGLPGHPRLLPNPDEWKISYLFVSLQHFYEPGRRMRNFGTRRASASLWAACPATIMQRRVAMKVAFPGGSSVQEGQVPLSLLFPRHRQFRVFPL